MERDQDQIQGDELLGADVIERRAFDQFSTRLERTVNEYINNTEASDSVSRANRTGKALHGIAQQVDGYLKAKVILN